MWQDAKEIITRRMRAIAGSFTFRHCLCPHKRRLEVFKTSHVYPVEFRFIGIFNRASNSNIMNQTRLYGQTLIKGDFNIFYEIKSENIEIITIWDCRQEPNKLKIKD